MNRKITRDEFLRIFGTTPEDYEARHPERVYPMVQLKPVPQPIPKPVPPQISTNRTSTNTSTPWYTEIGDAITTAGQNLAAGALAAIPTTAGMYDLVKEGVPAVYHGVMNEDNDAAPVIDRISDAFMKNIITPESIDKLAKIQSDALTQFKSENPHATEEDASKFLDKFADSDTYYDAVINEYPTSLQISAKGQDWANRVVGLNKRADQMSASDEVMQAIGGAFIGLPESVVSKLSRLIVKGIGKKIASNIATRAVVRTAEVFTPLTFPLTPTNIALNATAGAGLNEFLRAESGRDTLIDYNKLYDPDKLPEPENVAIATGVAAAVVLGSPVITRIIKDAITSDTKASIKTIGQSVGPTIEEQSKRLTPKLSKVTGVLDQNSPVKHGAQLYKKTNDTETVPLLDAAMSAASTVNRVEAENNALNYGILEGIDHNTVPYTQIDGVYNRLDPETKDVLDKYVYAVQRQQDSALYEKSLMKQMSSARADLHTAEMIGNKNKIKSAREELAKVQEKHTELKQDEPNSRSSMVNWSRAQVDHYIQAGELDPAVKSIGDSMRNVTNDLNEYMHKNGVISAEEAARRTKSRELYVPLRERSHVSSSGLTRRLLLFKDKFRSPDTEHGFYINTKERDVTPEGIKVNNPKTAIISFKEGIQDAVRSVAANNARRDVIDKLNALPRARGRLLRSYEFDLGKGRKTSSISTVQYHKLYPQGVKNEEDYVKVFRDGNIELYEFSDKSITKSLQFAPLSSVPLMNATRKMWQTFTTGLGAPWFPAKTFIWDAPLAQTTKEAGRSLGLIDTLGRRLAQGTPLEQPVDRILDNVFDPTIFGSVGLAVPYQLGLRAARAVGDKVALDLTTHSGIFNVIAKSGPRGEQAIRGIGTMMATAFDRSALAVMSRHMSTSLSHLNDVSKLTDDYAKAALKHTGPLKHLFNSYKAMLESFHMAAKTAFFSSNLGRLKLKYGAKIPENEMKKLVQETRNLTGDMSRQSNSKFIQNLTSTIPYSNAMIQGTRHLLSSAIPRPVAEAVNVLGGNMLTDQNTRFWSQFISGIVLPSLGASAVLSNWDGAEDYWYDRVPKWKQISVIPIPSVEALEYLSENGTLPQFNPKYINEVPLSPEFAVVLEPTKAGLRAFGMLGNGPNKLPGQYSRDVKNVMDQITSFATPPLLAALSAMNEQKFDLHGALTGQGMVQDVNTIPSGGANADMMTVNSDISQTVYNTIGSILSSSAQIVMQSWNVYDISRDEGEEFSKALNNAMDTASFEMKRRFPAISVPGLYDARLRLYRSTPESEYVHETMEELKPIIGGGRQISVENDKQGRGEQADELNLVSAQKLRDQNLKQLSQAVYDTLMRKGAYLTAQNAASFIRAELADLEASRYKAPDDEYNRVRNNMILALQEQTRIQAHELQKLESQIQKKIGRRFLRHYGVTFSYKTLADLVRKDVAR